MVPSALECTVVTEAAAPFRITHVNSAWTQLCGFTAAEACGKTLGMLQGEDTDAAVVRGLVDDLKEGKASSMEVTNYDKQGRPFRNFVRVVPLRNELGGAPTHMVGILQVLETKVEPMDEPSALAKHVSTLLKDDETIAYRRAVVPTDLTNFL